MEHNHNIGLKILLQLFVQMHPAGRHHGDKIAKIIGHRHLKEAAAPSVLDKPRFGIQDFPFAGTDKA